MWYDRKTQKRPANRESFGILNSNFEITQTKGNCLDKQ